MEPEARYTIIGAIVLALIAAAILALMWLGGRGFGVSYNSYSIYF